MAVAVIIGIILIMIAIPISVFGYQKYNNTPLFLKQCNTKDIIGNNLDRYVPIDKECKITP